MNTLFRDVMNEKRERRCLQLVLYESSTINFVYKVASCNFDPLNLWFEPSFSMI